MEPSQILHNNSNCNNKSNGIIINYERLNVKDGVVECLLIFRGTLVIAVHQQPECNNNADGNETFE